MPDMVSRLKMMNWSPVVVALVLLGLQGVGHAGSVRLVTAAQSTDDRSEEIIVMDETVVAGSFVDPFDTGALETVHDPLEPFNTMMFAFNHRADIYALRPAAKVYNAIVSPNVQNSLGNVFYNAGFGSRFLNNILQGKLGEAGNEVQRLLLNSTLGVGGLFDVATHMFGIDAPPTEDVGQTLAVYGVPAGPYLVMPMMPPLTVRDAVGFVGEMALNPVNYFLPFFPNMALNATERLNERARTLKQFEGIEASSVDLYGAVRSGYLDRRALDILE